MTLSTYLPLRAGITPPVLWTECAPRSPQGSREWTPVRALSDEELSPIA